MTNRATFQSVVFGLSVCLLTPASGPAEQTSATKAAPARVYTNEDLERVRPYRDELGASSVPAAAAPEAAGRSGRQPGPRLSEGARGHGEMYWRREAERVRERTRGLEAQAEVIRARIAARADDRRREQRRGRRASASPASLSSEPDAALQAQLAAIERRIRKTEEDLADRARRDYALPGWLR